MSEKNTQICFYLCNNNRILFVPLIIKIYVLIQHLACDPILILLPMYS